MAGWCEEDSQEMRAIRLFWLAGVQPTKEGFVAEVAGQLLDRHGVLRGHDGDGSGFKTGGIALAVERGNLSG